MKRTFRSRLRVLAVLAFSLAAVAMVLPAKAQNKAPELPFRTTPDGKVNFKDLLKLTRQPPARDRITDEALQAIKDEAAIEYGKGFTPTDVPTMPPRNDLYASSIILSDGKNHTILPQKALIHVPSLQAAKVVEEPEGKLIMWPEFLRQHRVWLRTQEIPLSTAKGDTPLSPQQMEGFKIGNAIVVAVLAGNPISMLEPKVPTDLTGEGDPLSLTEVSDPDTAPADGSLPKEDEKAGSASQATRNSRLSGMTKKEAADSLAQVKAEADTLAESSEDEAKAAAAGPGSVFKERSKSRFGRLSH